MFFEISQNSQENTCAKVFLNILVGLTLVFSCEFCEVFKNTLFYRTSLDKCFCICSHALYSGYSTDRGSRSQIFFIIGALKNFAKFTGKHLCGSLFKKTLLKDFIKKFIKNRLQHSYSSEFCKFFKNIFLQSTFRLLLL